MKKLLALVAGFFLSGFLIVTVNAGPTADSGSPQKSEKSGQAAPKKKLSKRIKAKIEVQEMKAKRNALAAGATK